MARREFQLTGRLKGKGSLVNLPPGKPEKCSWRKFCRAEKPLSFATALPARNKKTAVPGNPAKGKPAGPSQTPPVLVYKSLGKRGGWEGEREPFCQIGVPFPPPSSPLPPSNSSIKESIMAKSLFVDLTRCTGCRGCQIACKQWKNLPAEERRTAADTRTRRTFQRDLQNRAHARSGQERTSGCCSS